MDDFKLKIGDKVIATRQFHYRNGVIVREGETLTITKVHDSGIAIFYKETKKCFLPSDRASWVRPKYIKSKLFKVLNEK